MSGKAIKSGTFLGWIVLQLIQQSAVAEVPEEWLETPLAVAFGAPPTIGNPMLSPDGARLLFMQQDAQGASILLSLDLADGEITPVLRGTGEGYDIVWCELPKEARVFCYLRQGLPQQGPGFQRLVAVNLDGTELEAMPQLTVCLNYDDLRNQPPIDWSPDDPQRVLLHCIPRLTTLMNVYSGQLTDVSGAGEIGKAYRIVYFGEIQGLGSYEYGPGDLERVRHLYSNGHGLVNIYRGRQDNLDHWFIRDDVGSAWREFLTIDPLAFEAPFRPVGHGTRLDRVFNIGWDRDSETWSLYRKALDDGFENELVFAHPAVDVELVDTMGRYERVVSAVFLEDRPQRVIVDARVAEVYGILESRLPGIDIEIVDESWDQRRYLARVRAPRRTGEFLLVDMESESVEPVGPEYAHLAEVELAETRLVRFESSTGGSITAHLTLPSAAEGPVPAVIVPRPSPTHEDVADPHYLVQFLAASGYAVLRVRNRVEAAYGGGWLPERAFLGWRQSADDIRDAAAYLVDNGISEAGTICGAGKDYGAYAALMTAIEYPEVFRCIVSIGGVTDPRETPGGELLKAVGARASRDLLAEASPLRRAGELGAPVLMFNGAIDLESDVIEQMLVFRTALERAGKDVVAIEYPNARHAIGREPDRVDMLARISGFLAEQIGPPAAEVEWAAEAFTSNPR